MPSTDQSPVAPASPIADPGAAEMAPLMCLAASRLRSAIQPCSDAEQTVLQVLELPIGQPLGEP